ncbi:MAG: hypothetical protein WBF43_06455 [Methylocella sp.]
MPINPGDAGQESARIGKKTWAVSGRSSALTRIAKRRIMMNALKKFLAVVAVITVCATIQPGTLSAQTSGIGGDANTRLLWRGTDNRISLWKLDHSLNYVTSTVYGPYDTWLPIALTTNADNNTVVLWRNTNGSISLWKVDPNLNYVTSVLYGPYAGWTADALSADTDGSSYIRVIWRETGGSVSVWCVDPNLNYCGNKVYGPYFGYDPGTAAATFKSAASEAANAKAAAAMATKASVKNPHP